MPTKDPYPESLRVLVHQLYYEQKKRMKDVIPILKKKYPKYAKRITVDRMHSVARIYRQNKGLEAKNEKMSKAHKGKSSNMYPRKKEFLEEARKLRQKNYRWNAIVEELKLKFPNDKVPPANALAAMARGQKPRSNSTQYHMAITAPSGAVINIELTGKKFEQVLKQLLEV